MKMNGTTKMTKTSRKTMIVTGRRLRVFTAQPLAS
jgi:hypothetical protein